VFSKGAGIFSALPPPRGLHQIPVAAVSSRKKILVHRTRSRPIHRFTGVGDARHALHAGTRDGVDDEKEQPGTKSIAQERRLKSIPTASRAPPFSFLWKARQPPGREFRNGGACGLEGLFGTPWRNACRGRNGVRKPLNGMDRREETITLAGNGFDKARILGVILNGGTELLQGGI